MSEQEIDVLFQRTLSDDYEDETAWEAVRALRRLGTREVFDKAAEWCGSLDPLKRARGADVMAQLGRTCEHPTTNFAEDAYSVLMKMLEKEKEIQPLDSAIVALAFVENPSAVPVAAKFCSHPSAEIRHSVAYTLGQFSNDPRSVETLLFLMEDSDEDVRDWATFGLALGESDSPEIRDAFLRRLNDTFRDAREEAMVGLAKLKDERVLPALIAHLEQPEISPCVEEAAISMLDIKDAPDDWNGPEYANALRQRFTLSAES